MSTVSTPTHGSALAAAFNQLPGSQRFTTEEREVIYRLAYSALKAGQTGTARRYFEWLVVYAGAEPRHWRGLAACAQAGGEPGQALLYWSMVTLLEPGALDATLQAGRCQVQLGELQQALATFDLVRRHAPAGAPLRQQAEQMLALLHKRQRQAA